MVGRVCPPVPEVAVQAVEMVVVVAVKQLVPTVSGSAIIIVPTQGHNNYLMILGVTAKLNG